MSTNMKNIIADAFFAMVKERGIDKVTVKDLVESCHISRQTFYYHFQDILDVVEWSAQKAVETALEHALEASRTNQSPDKAIGEFVAAAVENRELIEKMLNSQKRDFMDRVFVKALQDYMRGLVRNVASDVPVSPEDAEVAIQFYSYGVAGVLLENTAKPDCDPDKLARQLLGILRGSYFNQAEFWRDR